MKEMRVTANKIIHGDHINHKDVGWDCVVKVLNFTTVTRITFGESCMLVEYPNDLEVTVRRVTWQGETKCDFCKKETSDNLYDCKTFQGPWAVCCPICWATHAYYSTLGQGKGQRYVNLIKVEG